MEKLQHVPVPLVYSTVFVEEPLDQRVEAKVGAFVDKVNAVAARADVIGPSLLLLMLIGVTRNHHQ